ncbi:DUF4407 domain-containing protein [Hyphobacterium sp. CCMP332]|nr:DUF4407 domain-containing protein [Hyphobacterium sp. CCMP332]
MQKVKLFFWYCAGANTSLLQKAETDSEKYVGIGATIFFTGVFAALAAAYALHSVFDSWIIASVFGLVWGLMIFNLDRFIVSSMRKKESAFNEFLLATPRIILAILISIVIAKPLELKIFEKEINAELISMNQEVQKGQENFAKEKYLAEKASLDASISGLKSEIQQKEQQRDALREKAQKEADGTGGTMRRNAGPIYKIKKADADRVDAELKNLKEKNLALIADNYGKLTQLDSNMQSDLAVLGKAEIGGPAARLEAMDRLSTKSEAIWWANFFIMMLFIVVECAPIFVKLISSKGPYDYLLEAREYGFESAILKDKAYIHSELKKEAEAFNAKEKGFVFDRLDVKLDSM